MKTFEISEEEGRRLAQQREEISARLQAENEIAEAACTHKLNLQGRRAKAIISGFMKRHEMQTGGCRTFYAPVEWKARKEQYGTESVLVVVYDGGDLHSVMSHEFGHGMSEELDKLLAAEGLYFEACTNWYSGVYPIPGWRKKS